MTYGVFRITDVANITSKYLTPSLKSDFLVIQPLPRPPHSHFLPTYIWSTLIIAVALNFATGHTLRGALLSSMTIIQRLLLSSYHFVHVWNVEHAVKDRKGAVCEFSDICSLPSKYPHTE